MVSGHEVSLDVGGEGLSPDERLSCGVEVDSTHPGLRGVGGTQESRLLRYDLGEVGGPVAEVGGQAGEVRKVLAKVASDSDTVAFGPREG